MSSFFFFCCCCFCILLPFAETLGQYVDDVATPRPKLDRVLAQVESPQARAFGHEEPEGGQVELELSVNVGHPERHRAHAEQARTVQHEA